MGIIYHINSMINILPRYFFVSGNLLFWALFLAPKSYDRFCDIQVEIIRNGYLYI